MSSLVGTIIDGRYEVLCVLGEGGLGQVLLANHVRLGGRVALKVLRPHVARDRETVARFREEARACASIQCEHAVRVADIGELPGGEPYLVMEYLDGETLEKRVEREGRLDLRTLADVAIDLLDGLSAVHSAGVLHRDVKPANIVLTKTSAKEYCAKLVDFGLAKPVDGRGRASKVETLPGIVMGTPAYMSPEQASDRPLDARTDLFSLGIVLYEAACGQRPFAGEAAADIMASILVRDAIPLASRLPDVDPTLAAIIHKALQRAPADRFASAAEMRDMMMAWRTLAFASEVADASLERLTRDPLVSGVTGVQRPPRPASHARLAATAQPPNAPPSTDGRTRRKSWLGRSGILRRSRKPKVA